MELIDKKAALKAIYLAGELINKYGGRFYEGKFYGCQSAYEIIKDMPTVEERQHGYWKNGCCTVCGESAATDGHFDFIAEEEQKFCWNCGAIMDGRKEKSR